MSLMDWHTGEIIGVHGDFITVQTPYAILCLNWKIAKAMGAKIDEKKLRELSKSQENEDNKDDEDD